MHVKLLGRPAVLTESPEAATRRGPRGSKAWALLAYLVCAGAPAPRERLVAMLFPDADDGLAALRWSLAELRRALAAPHAFSGDPVRLGLGAEVQIDVSLLESGAWYDVVDLPGLTDPLLQGVTVHGCPAFDLWLEAERSRVSGLAATTLREAARAETAHGRPAAAVPYARRLAELEPWDESGHELLVRALAQSGDVAAASAHVDAVTRYFCEQFGEPPSRELRAAAQPIQTRVVGATETRARTQLRAGESAMAAGASEQGIESLGRAVGSARALGEPSLLMEALTAYGSALVHAVRGSDESGASALQEAVAVAERAGHPEWATTACRELAYVEFLRSRIERAERWLDRAMATVGADEAERAWILLIRGSLRSDAGRHQEALSLLAEAVRHAENAGDLRAAAFSLTHIGRVHVLRGEPGPARAALDHAVSYVEQVGWLSFLPYPVAWLGEVALLEARLDLAADRFSQAHALALEVADPCWESLAARGLGVVAMLRGEDEEAARWLKDAPLACRRFTDTYVWLEAYAWGAQAEHAVRAGRGTRAVDALEKISASHGMRDLQAWAAVLRARAGVPGAVEVARSLVRAVDNPALRQRLDEVE